jgi:hypothetical protein
VKILGIESSCDETAAAVIENGERLLSNVVNSQIDIHAEYGGVIPEIAARSHLEVVNPVIRAALSEANCTWDDIDAIAVTYAPGLIGSLLVGTLAARTPAFPKARFESTSVKALPTAGQYEVVGTLTIKGQKQTVTVPARFTEKAGQGVFEGKLTIQRGAFSIGEGAWKAFDIVANDVVVHFQLTAK